MLVLVDIVSMPSAVISYQRHCVSGLSILPCMVISLKVCEHDILQSVRSCSHSISHNLLLGISSYWQLRCSGNKDEFFRFWGQKVKRWRSHRDQIWLKNTCSKMRKCTFSAKAYRLTICRQKLLVQC